MGESQPRDARDGRRKRTDGVRTLDDIRGRCWVNDLTGCWEWRGALSRSNTRSVSPTTRVWLPDAEQVGSGRIVTASRAAWLLAGHSLPDDHVVWRSVCGSSQCVNPAHCSAGTRQQMHAAIAASGRLRDKPHRRAVNARNRLRMVTPLETVREAEAMFARGEMQKTVVAQLRMTAETAALIRKGLHPHSAGRLQVVRGASVFNLGATR